jgi:hypothetical protein
LANEKAEPRLERGWNGTPNCKFNKLKIDTVKAMAEVQRAGGSNFSTGAARLGLSSK